MKLPVLFVGHGSPMNALENNEFSREWGRIGKELPRPDAILCVSAHWLTRGSAVTAMEKPRTIHDFGGFPPELYQMSYPAPGNPALAAHIRELLASPGPALTGLDAGKVEFEAGKVEVGLDQGWGLDHGTWSVLRRMFPKADIPVLQLSIDTDKPAAWHYSVAHRLKNLREEGVLIIASGNIVHNLSLIAWTHMDESGFGFEWALEFDAAIADFIHSGEDEGIIHWENLGKAAKLAVPTTDHFLPLLYALGARDPADKVRPFNAKAVAGSLTMTSYQWE